MKLKLLKMRLNNTEQVFPFIPSTILFIKSIEYYSDYRTCIISPRYTCMTV